jgi:UPF0271 protein
MIKLNCDMGEGMAYDTQIMPLIDMANLACGEHAGDAQLMRTNVQLAKKYSVEVGAHPSYPDREHFGRVSMQMAPDRLEKLLHRQIGQLESICNDEGVKLSYVKPHGALYNDMMRDKVLFETIVQAVGTYNDTLKLMILSSAKNSEYAKIAATYGIALLYELFADRNYTDEGALVPREERGAVIEDVVQSGKRTVHYQEYGELLSITGKVLNLTGDSLCVHGDNKASLAVIVALRDVLREMG